MVIGSIAGGGSTESTLDLQAKIKALRQQEQRLRQKVDDLLQERDSSTKQQEIQLYEAQIQMIEAQIQQLEAQQAKAAQARQERNAQKVDSAPATTSDRAGSVDLYA